MEKFMNKLIGILIFIGLFTPAAFGQNLDLLKIEYSYIPYSQYKNSPNSPLNNIETQVRKLSVSLSFPIRINSSKTYLINSFSGQMLNFGIKNIPAQFTYVEPDRLYLISYSLSFLHYFNRTWSMILSLKPVLASDLNNVKNDHYKLQGESLFGYNINKFTQVGFGASYNADFGKYQFLPLFKLMYYDSEKFMINAIIPQSFNISYFLKDAFQLGFAGSVEGNNYRIGDSNSPIKNSSLKFSNLVVGPFFKINISNNLYLRFDSGIVFNRIYENYNSVNNNIRQVDLKNNYFVNGSISVSIDK